MSSWLVRKQNLSLYESSWILHTLIYDIPLRYAKCYVSKKNECILFFVFVFDSLEIMPKVSFFVWKFYIFSVEC